MLHFLSDAPEFVVRELVAFARGFVESAGWEAPLWAQSLIHIHEEDAGVLLSQLKQYRIEGAGRARVAIGDPTFALAAAAIERGNDGSPSSASYAR